MQQANRVEQGMVVGRREVQVSAEGSTGAATGAAAGGVLGAQTPGGGIGAALGGVGGALIGGLIGTATEHVVVDTKAFEYVVRTAKQELVSVTQRDTTPLVVGQRVLVIAGNQARSCRTTPPSHRRRRPRWRGSAGPGRARHPRDAHLGRRTHHHSGGAASAGGCAAPPPPSGETSSGPGLAVRQKLEESAASQLPPVALPMVRAMGGEATP
ncbi:hypothetical protein ACFQU2_24955 [Siccirubricoccus deserti]